jgi:hypothetical protein
MGDDVYADGFEASRRTIEVFCRQAHDLGITGRLIAPEDYFAEFLASS